MARSGLVACVLIAFALIAPTLSGMWSPEKPGFLAGTIVESSACDGGVPCEVSDAVAEAGPDRVIGEGGRVVLNGSASRGSFDRGKLPDIANYSCPFDTSNVTYPSEPLGSYVNFVRNGDFGADMMDWFPYGHVSISTGFAYSGSKSLKVDGPNGTNAYVAQDVSDVGSLFLMYFWIYIVSLSDDPVVVELIREWDPNTGSARLLERFEFYAAETRWTAWDVRVAVTSPLTTNAWHRVVVAGDATQKATCWWLDWNSATCAVLPNVTPFIADHLLMGDTSWQGSSGLVFLDKIILVGVGAGGGKEFAIVSFEWDLNDKQDSDGNGNFTDDVDATGPAVDMTYGDNGDYVVTLTVTDSAGKVARDTATVHVNNLDPLSTGVNITAIGTGDLGLRVAGRKWNTVGMSLSEDGVAVASANLTRQPGSPDEQIAWISGPFDSSRNYEVNITYEPLDLNGSEVGANPVWLVFGVKDNYSVIDHHTFNVQQSEKKGSKHWNHIDPWIVDLTGRLGGGGVRIDANAMDFGSDDLTFAWNLTMVSTRFNNGMSPDQPDSPGGTFPFFASDTVLMPRSPGAYVDLVISDDDGGSITVRIAL